ncbi:hypothetical protein C1646_759999 [Rhizophagus diaphanus]|nr:hypothetical protein C1646_759999 [Rhizophagus diaphanus] [Rhizophagus sp. MUCL 43196]
MEIDVGKDRLNFVIEPYRVTRMVLDDNSDKRIYHCDYCEVCHIGKGLGIDYFRCEKCNRCHVKFSKTLEWVEYDRFENVKSLAEGDFGTTYKAIWKDCPIGRRSYLENNQCIRSIENISVVLKCLHDSQNITVKFLQDIEPYALLNVSYKINVFMVLLKTQNPNNYDDELNILEDAKNNTLTLIYKKIETKKDKIWVYLEPELYELVKNIQIYTYFSYLRYIYCYTKEEDLYIVPYHTPTLFLWNRHVNFKIVKPPYVLQQEEQLSPYWDDAINKYFDRPIDKTF